MNKIEVLKSSLIKPKLTMGLGLVSDMSLNFFELVLALNRAKIDKKLLSI